MYVSAAVFALSAVLALEDALFLYVFALLSDVAAAFALEAAAVALEAALFLYVPALLSDVAAAFALLAAALTDFFIFGIYVLSNAFLKLTT